MNLLFGSVVALVISIVPTQSRDATRSIILKRGGNDVVELKVSKPEGSVEEVAKKRSTIAVLPLKVPAGGDLVWQRTGVMDSVLADLRYIPNFLVLDRSEILAVESPTTIDEGTVAAVASKLGAQYIIAGTLAGEADNLTLSLSSFKVEKGVARRTGTSTATGSRNEIYSIEDKAVLALLDQNQLTPDAARIAEIKKIPTKNFKARSKVDEGFAILDQIVKGDGKRAGEFVEINERAKKLAEEALKADRKRFLLAHQLRATCLYNLCPDPTRPSDELKECLKQAIEVNYPDRLDSIRSLELQGDEAVFNGNFKNAIKAYEQILSYDPGNLTALWTLSCLSAGDLGEGGDKARADKYASQLVFFHPKSAAAADLKPKPR